MNIHLTDHQENYIKAKLATGGYSSVSEVIREALRIMEAQDRDRAARLRDLRQALDEAEESGDYEPWEGAEAIIQEARARRAKSRSAASS